MGVAKISGTSGLSRVGRPASAGESPLKRGLRVGRPASAGESPLERGLRVGRPASAGESPLKRGLRVGRLASAGESSLKRGLRVGRPASAGESPLKRGLRPFLPTNFSQTRFSSTPAVRFPPPAAYPDHGPLTSGWLPGAYLQPTAQVLSVRREAGKPVPG